MNNVQADPNALVCSALELCIMWCFHLPPSPHVALLRLSAGQVLSCQSHRCACLWDLESMAAILSKEHCSNLE
jgi:hypothetical protein